MAKQKELVAWDKVFNSHISFLTTVTCCSSLDVSAAVVVAVVGTLTVESHTHTQASDRTLLWASRRTHKHERIDIYTHAHTQNTRTRRDSSSLNVV